MPGVNCRAFSFSRLLCVNTALANGVRDAIDGEHVSRNTVVYVVRFGVANNVFERRAHDVIELFVDDRFLPEISLTILNPFEVRSGYAAGVGENVGDDEDVFVGEDFVGVRGGWTV